MANHLCLIIISLSLSLYMLLDGRALAMSILLLFLGGRYKVRIFNVILPSWDANQTWLVFSLASLYGAYSTIFSHYFSTHYLTLLAMLLCFLLRGSAIEFSLKETHRKKLWHVVLAFSSLLIVILQSFLVVNFILEQQSFFYVSEVSSRVILIRYILGISGLLLFHMGNALSSIDYRLNVFCQYLLVLVIGLSFLVFIGLSYFWGGPEDNAVCNSTLFVVLVIASILLFIVLFFKKRCLRYSLNFLAIVSISLIFYCLYPYKSADGSLVLGQASSADTVTIIAIASLLCLPGLVITMKITQRVFASRASTSVLDY